MVGERLHTLFELCLSAEGVVIPLSAMEESAIAHMSLPTGMQEGLIINFCWKEMVSLSCLLLAV